MKSSEIRQAFFKYFKQQGHHLVDSSSLIPANDPTLLFTNAGMQLRLFLGLNTRSYQRAVSSQRCVRAVVNITIWTCGYTARHHTFFEMLGNFSFGDYFNEKPLLAWDFLTKVMEFAQEAFMGHR